MVVLLEGGSDSFFLVEEPWLIDRANRLHRAYSAFINA